jgi:pimeloyl-ACP methyl ester carboxylesterase
MLTWRLLQACREAMPSIVAAPASISDSHCRPRALDAWVSDLETVVKAVGVERFPLIGISQGCAVSVAYAARHPE